MDPYSLVVLTLNVWGLLIVSKRRGERVTQLGHQLSQSGADVVALQEVWVRGDAEYLREKAASGGRLLHSHVFKSGLFGPGMMILSRHPIVETTFYPFAVTGDPAKVLGGDYYGAKGVGHARLSVSPGQPDRPAVRVDVLVTHTHANYDSIFVPMLLTSLPRTTTNTTAGDLGETQSGRDEDVASPLDTGIRVPIDEDAGIRLANVVQLGQIAASLAAVPGSRVVVAGDLNSIPNSLEMAALRQLVPSLRDAWAEAQPLLDGFTCNTADNSWASSSNPPVRIDYVWSSMTPLDARILVNKTPGGFSVSDHRAVEATLDLRHPADSVGGGLPHPPVPSNVPKWRLPHKIWSTAAERTSENMNHLAHRRTALLWLSFLLLATAAGLYTAALWSRSSVGGWDDITRRRLFDSQRLDREKGFIVAHAGSCSSFSWFRAMLATVSGTAMVLAAAVIWLMSYIGLTSQIRALEDARGGLRFMAEAAYQPTWQS